MITSRHHSLNRRSARVAAALFAVLSLVAASVLTATASASATSTSTLVAIRAASHSGYDRVVFELTGPLPSRRSVAYVPQLLGDGSGLPVPVPGGAVLRVVMSWATGHSTSGKVTYGPARRTYALPSVLAVVNGGDNEGVLTFGIGTSAATAITVMTLTSPSRLVIDVRHPAVTEKGSVALLDISRYATGRTPYVIAVPRTLTRPANAVSALHLLFAGPTAAEQAAGLRFVSSMSTGFTGLTISGGVAKVRLVGGCASGGSTFTVANHLTATLRQFASVRWVKIYDPSGRTESPLGAVDSIPLCLEP